MKNLLFGVLFLPLSLFAQPSAKIESFKLQEVQLLPSVFLNAETVDKNYMMSMNPDRLLAPYLREAGLKPKAESYTNWENTGLDGHVGGHYMTALSLMYASTGDKKVLERLNYMLAELKKCQDNSGGFLSGVPGSKAFFDEIAAGKVESNLFGVNKKWVPFYNVHKMFAGLRDAYLYTDSKLAKEMFIRYCDYLVNITSKLTDDQIQKILVAEHGGMNEVLADASAITGDKKYLELAKKFSHKLILEPLSKKQDKLDNIHANTQIPKIIGFERIAELSGDADYATAARFFWETVVEHRSCAIGGNSVREHFHPANNFSSMINSEQGPETCNTYNMLKLTKQLYQADGNEKYMDYYERALYNHILSTEHPEKGGFVYFTPMRPNHYRVYSQAQQGMWCCVGSGLENHGKYGELIYAHNATDVFVNLFIPSKLTWKEKGIELSQQTNFPEEEQTTLTIDTLKTSDFTLQVRYPIWCNDLKISINGKNFEFKGEKGSYIAIKRAWKKGDKIVISLPMQTTTEQFPDKSDYVAVLHGPIVLAAKTSTEDLKGLFADDSRMGHIATGKQFPLQDAPMFVSNATNLATFITSVPNKTMTFSAKDLLYPEKYKSLELIPFYKVHDSRYSIYFQTVTPEKLKEQQEKIAKEEAEKQKLAAITLDMVACGEQQPESDHFYESEKSNMGTHKNRHWRDASGWFSYKMKDKDLKADRLQVMYYGLDANRKFSILVNNQSIAEVSLDGSMGDKFYTVDYAIPEKLVKESNGVVVVKFAAAQGSVAGGVFEVRLLKK